METEDFELAEAGETQSRLLAVTALANEYCSLVEGARENEKTDFVEKACRLLPAIYLDFTDPTLKEEALMPDFGGEMLSTYVDEDFYEAVRRNIEVLLGPDDTFLETFEEDMKYSESPIAASVGECMADIFQALYNFISLVRESEGLSTIEAYLSCRDDFNSYWGQTLCNVMRPLNTLRVYDGE